MYKNKQNTALLLANLQNLSYLDEDFPKVTFVLSKFSK